MTTTNGKTGHTSVTKMRRWQTMTRTTGMCQNTRRLPSQHTGAAGLVTEKQVHANRSGDPLGHGAVSKARVKELKNMQDHNVFEVVWLESVIDRTYAVAARREGEVVKASFVAQQVACDSRDHVFAGTPWAVTLEPKHRRDQAHGLFDIISCRELSVDEFSGADPSNWHLCPQDSDYFCEEPWTERARHQHFRLRPVRKPCSETDGHQVRCALRLFTTRTS